MISETEVRTYIGKKYARNHAKKKKQVLRKKSKINAIDHAIDQKRKQVL